MGFFSQDFPPEPNDEEQGILYAPRPEFPGAEFADEYLVPAVLPWMRKLGQGPTAQVWLRHAEVRPNGFMLHLAVYRKAVRRLRFRPPPYPAWPGDRHGLRVGTLFADGTRTTSAGHGNPLPRPPGVAQQLGLGPILTLMPRGGSEFVQRYEAHLDALPPDGSLTVVVEWPAADVPETHTEMDATAIVEAAADAVQVWSDLPPAPGPPGCHWTSIAYGPPYGAPPPGPWPGSPPTS